MAFFLVSFIAGILTVLAPCILPLLPVVVGSSAAGRSRSTPYVVVAALSISIIIFTYALKATTALIAIPPQVWAYFSGGMLILLGMALFLPSLWERIPGLAVLSARTNVLVGSGYERKSFWGDVIIGASLGPVFSSCSPTYFVILATVLPASFFLGSLYLLAYVSGLSVVLLFIGLLGQRFADHLTGLSNPRGYLKRGIGVLFILLGVLIASGYEKKFQAQILEGGYFDVTNVERFLLEKL